MVPYLSSSSAGHAGPIPLPPSYQRVVLHYKAPLVRRLLGSALSALVGWLSLSLYSLAAIIWNGFSGDYFLVPAVAFLIIFAVWGLLLIPLYLLIPRTWFLWWWPVCTFCGALAGFLIVLFFMASWASVSELTPFVLLAALTGGATCLCGALTAPYFHDERKPKNCSEKGNEAPSKKPAVAT
jgi:hypothetical protein